MASMGSDNVNSISDLEESLDIAEKIREVYEDLMSLEDWEHLRTLAQLESLSDSEKPNYLRVPDGVAELKSIRYDTRASVSDSKKFTEIEQCLPEDFIELTMGRDSSATSTSEITDPSGVILFIKNNIAPSFWTSFDGEYIVFDSYDSSIDSTLQQSKNMCQCVKETVFTLEDNFIPDMPSKMFPAFIQEATRVCSLYFKEQPSANDERRAFRSLANMKNKSSRSSHKKIKYGRR